MPFMDGQSLLTSFVILLGCGLFLRMVAKEKRRREKYLELRLIEKRHCETEQRDRQAAAATEAVAEVIPIAPPEKAAA